MILAKICACSLSVMLFNVAFLKYSQASSSDAFRKKEIAAARFGEGSRELYLNKAYRLAQEVEREVKGQSDAARILQNRLVQYFEGFGTRNKEPIYMNLIGLP